MVLWQLNVFVPIRYKKDICMNEAWKIFFEMYFSNGADIFVFVIAPMLWVSSMFIARRLINCWQISKTTCFIVMYGHVFINLLVLPLNGGGFGNAIGVWVLLVVVAPVFPWITALVLNVIELVCYGKKKIYTAKGRELKDFLIIRSVSQLVLLLMIALGHFYTTVVHCAGGVSC